MPGYLVAYRNTAARARGIQTGVRSAPVNLYFVLVPELAARIAPPALGVFAQGFMLGFEATWNAMSMFDSPEQEAQLNAALADLLRQAANEVMGEPIVEQFGDPIAGVMRGPIKWDQTKWNTDCDVGGTEFMNNKGFVAAPYPSCGVQVTNTYGFQRPEEYSGWPGDYYGRWFALEVPGVGEKWMQSLRLSPKSAATTKADVWHVAVPLPAFDIYPVRDPWDLPVLAPGEIRAPVAVVRPGVLREPVAYPSEIPQTLIEANIRPLTEELIARPVALPAPVSIGTIPFTNTVTVSPAAPQLVRKIPGPRVKEKKPRGKNGQAMLYINGLTEVVDFIRALHEALPKELQAKCKPPPCHVQDWLAALYDAGSYIANSEGYIREALIQVLVNEIEDAFYGISGMQYRRAADQIRAGYDLGRFQVGGYQTGSGYAPRPDVQKVYRDAAPPHSRIAPRDKPLENFVRGAVNAVW